MLHSILTDHVDNLTYFLINNNFTTIRKSI